MFNWFKKTHHKDLPEYWQDYEDSFEEDLSPTRYVVLDTETTGFDYKKDRILSIGAVTIIEQDIAVNEVLEVFLEQKVFNPKTVSIHGILKSDKHSKLNELEAIKQFLGYVKNAIIVAHHANFDINMLNEALNRHGLPKLKNKVLDTGYLFKKSRIRSNLLKQDESYSLDTIAEKLSITIQDRHTAIGDAYITALIFLKIRTSLAQLKKIHEPQLLKMAVIIK